MPRLYKSGFEGGWNLTAVERTSLLCTSCNRVAGDGSGVGRGVGKGDTGRKRE